MGLRFLMFTSFKECEYVRHKCGRAILTGLTLLDAEREENEAFRETY